MAKTQFITAVEADREISRPSEKEIKFPEAFERIHRRIAIATRS
jgi:hypothetical protein